MKSKLVFGLVVILMLLSGCLSLKQAEQPVEYYTLEYDPPDTPETSALPFIIKFEPFSTSPVYDSNRISYKEQKFKRREYAYHKWRAVPGEMVTAFLARDFARTSLFQAVVLSETVPGYSHLLSGQVEEFYQQSEHSPWEAVLSIHITLSSMMPNDIQNPTLFQKRYSCRERSIQQTPESFVEAMSRAMKQVSAEVIQDVYENLKR
jgi:cholesterol transport system auxiliary component